MSESINAEFEAYVKAELSDIAVVSEGRFISPKIQNYFKVWSFLEAVIFNLQLENESLKQVARFETDVAAQAIADFEAMKLEVEALRKNAAVYKAIDRACTELPSTHQIEITISKGYGGVKLFDDCLDEVDFDDTDINFYQQIHSAIDAAIKEQV